MGEVHARLGDEGLHVVLPPSESMSCHAGQYHIDCVDVSYVDGTVIFAQSDTPGGLIEASITIVAIVVEVLSKYGLVLNF